MKTLRTAVGAFALLLLAGGYLVSQATYFFGDPARYVAALDSSSVPVLSLLVLVALVVCCAMPDGEAERP